MTARGSRAMVACLVAALSGCGGGDAWEHPSPALDLPGDFTVASDAGMMGRNTFPTRPVEASIAWEFHRGGDASQIRMVRLGGSTRPEDVWAAVNQLQKDNQSWTFTGPETRQVAGRPSWEWSAEVPSRQGTVWAMQRTLIVAFPDSTWVTSFWGQHREWQDQAKMDAVLSSFHIPQPPRPLPKHPLIVVSLLLLVGGVLWLRRRPEDQPARTLQSRDPVHTPQPNPAMPGEPGMDPMVIHR